MKKLITCLVLLIPVHTNIKAAILTAVSSGNWDSPFIWDAGRVPVCGDTIIVPALFLVNINNNVNLNDPTDALCPAVRISIAGRIDFTKGKKIRLVDGACVTVEWGGSVHPSELGGGKSESINIGNDTWWKSADGVLNGLAAMGCVSPMPVDEVDLMLVQLDDKIKLTWECKIQDYVDYFVLEKSGDGFGWEVLATVSATTDADRAYTVYDDKSLETKYYRLKSVSNEGMVNVLQTEVWQPSVNYTKDALSVYPNPAASNQVIVLAFDNEVSGNATLGVYNQLGQLVYTQDYQLSNNEHNITLDATKLDHGQYHITITNNEKRISGKLVIL